jgi:hypothetical protein
MFAAIKLLPFIIAAIVIHEVKGNAYPKTDDFDIIKEKVVAELLKPGIDDRPVESILARMAPDGSFHDIKYDDLSRTAGFPHRRHTQHDYSFHHRVDRVNNTTSYGYGKYANVFGEWSYYVAGTSYAFSLEKIKQLVDYSRFATRLPSARLCCLLPGAVVCNQIIPYI